MQDDAIEAERELQRDERHEFEQALAESAEEHEDEDDEDEDEDLPRKRRRNRFLDIEAEVDDDDEEEDDDADLEQNDGFVHGDEDVEQLDPTNLKSAKQQHARPQDEKLTEEDAERLAEEYRHKYGRSAAAKYRGEGGAVPQRLLLPSVHDPSIFGISCRIGKEKDAVRALLRKHAHLRYTANPLQILSAFQRDAFPGRVYVEARTQKAALQACKGIVNLYTSSKLLLVPIKEYPDLFRARKSQDTELVPGVYVRVKRGKYAGDLALVENLTDNGVDVQLRLVPRLDYGRGISAVVQNVTDKRKRATASNRPPQRLFSSSEAAQYDARNLQRRGANAYNYDGEDYDGGFLIKDFRVAHLQTESVNPTLGEITQLTGSASEGIDLHALSQSLNKDASKQLFAPGEAAQVVSGELAGMYGRVIGSHDDIVELMATTKDKKQKQKISVPASQLRKFFSVGDHVRVTAGNYADDTGMVTDRDKDKVTLLSDLSQTEITVLAKDLKMAADIGGANTLGKYSLHDLVQLNAQVVGCIVDIERDRVKVLAQDGQVVVVKPSSIIMKIVAGRNVATDLYGRQIEVGDTVRENVGERRQGAVLHIINNFVFLHNREITENLGVFVNGVMNVTTVATKSARDEKGLDLSKMNPMAMQHVQQNSELSSSANLRRVIGQKISIGAGSSYKGFKGLVKDVNDSSARVELEARNKIVSVDITKLLFKARDGSNVPLKEYLYQARQFDGPRRPQYSDRRDMPQRQSQPQESSYAAAPKTPAWSAGSKTPAWAAGGSRTPAWNAGSKTPAWNSGSKTPAWSSGSKTPAWNADSGKTPAWNADGGKTPAWNADGGRTPAWNAESGKTPAWSGQSSTWDSGRTAPTPGFFSAATPGAAPTPAAPTPGVFEAQTPGVYSARTPGVAATPAAWGGDDEQDDDDAPQYEDEED